MARQQRDISIFSNVARENHNEAMELVINFYERSLAEKVFKALKPKNMPRRVTYA